MESIAELEKYLEEEQYSFNALAIGKHRAQQGYVIEKNGNAYEFSYLERGSKNVVCSFSNEKDLVEYAYEKLLANKWKRAHVVARSWSEDEIQRAEQELKNKGIAFERNDDINYSEEGTLYRIMVFGRDIEKLTEFKKKYL